MARAKRGNGAPSVLVTGAGRGIGLAITKTMSDAGWTVYATARSSTAVAELDALPGVVGIELDITDRASIAGLASHLPHTLAGVVNNAGIIVNGPVEGVKIDDLSRQLDVNVVSQIAVTQAVLPAIRAGHGRVVFISSVNGFIATPGTGAYSASKFALEALADALRIELRPWKIPVSLVEPGPIATDMWGTVLDEHDAMVDGLDDGVGELYASHLAGTRKLLGRVQKIAADPARVTKAVHHALTASRPRRRYLLDTASRVQKVVVSMSPTAVTDRVFSAATTA